jgi:hypothetical protein
VSACLVQNLRIGSECVPSAKRQSRLSQTKHSHLNVTSGQSAENGEGAGCTGTR